MADFNGPDPFADERQYSRTAAAYAIILFVLFLTGVGLYYFKYRHLKPPVTQNTVIREDIEEALED